MAVTPTDITGLNVLDNFAVKALGFLIQKYESTSIPVDEIVSRAYDYADAMRTRSAALRAAGDIGSDLEVSIVKGGQNSASGSELSYTNALQVAIVAGGGGSGGSTDLTSLLTALGYNPTASTPVTQSSRFEDLIDAIEDGSKLDKDEVITISTSSYIDYILAFYSQDNYKYPVKITPATLSKLVQANPTIQSKTSLGTTNNDIVYPGNYYKCLGTTWQSYVWLPTYTQAQMEAKIILIRFKTSVDPQDVSHPNPTISIEPADSNDTTPVRYRSGSATLEANTDYEIDIVYNDSEWIAGITKITSTYGY